MGLLTTGERRMLGKKYPLTHILREDDREGELALREDDAETPELTIEALEARVAPDDWRCPHKKTAGWGC
jgi:hypothetical protein